jgi:hypothetical protein
MKLHIMQFSPTSYYLIPLRSKYFHHPLLNVQKRKILLLIFQCTHLNFVWKSITLYINVVMLLFLRLIKCHAMRT